MAYFEDISPYTYSLGESHILNVAWLASGYPFNRGPVSEKFATRLQRLAKNPCRMTRGYHYCDLCIPPQDIIEIAPDYLHVWSMNRCGNGEIRIRAENSMTFSAPSLIWHYIMEHQYQPPSDFLDAVIYATDNPKSQPNWDSV
jgi:hypothetical protein